MLIKPLWPKGNIVFSGPFLWGWKMRRSKINENWFYLLGQYKFWLGRFANNQDVNERKKK